MFDERRFKAQMVLSGLSNKNIAELLGIDESTLYRKIKRDGDFTREEINKLIEAMRIDEPEAIFFASELA